MKKALMAIAATVLAFGFAFGFTACGNGGDSGNGGNGGNGGNSESSSGGGEGIADDSVLTEEQWKQAFEATLASKTFTMEQDSQITSTAPKGDGSGTETRVEVGKQCYNLDLNNYIMYNLTQYKVSVDGGEQRILEASERYTVCSETKIIAYYYLTNTTWQISETDKGSAEAAKTAFEEQGKQIMSYVLGEFTATVNGETVTKPLAELFGAFTYDSTTHVYTGEIAQYAGTEHEIKFTAEITFKNGKISKMDSDGIYYSSGDHAVGSTTFSYGEVNIVIPQEAKDALAAQ